MVGVQVRVWFYCPDCGRWGNRYTRTQAQPRTPLAWGFLSDPVRDVPGLAKGLPFEEFE